VAVTLVGPASSTGNTAFASSRAIPVPNNGGANPLAADDVVVVRLSRWESINPAITAPGGWIARTQQVNGSGKLNLFLKRLTAADTGTYTFSWTGSMWTTGQARAYRGVDPTADLSTAPLHQVTNSGTSWPAATLNSVGAGVLDWHGYSESNGNPHVQPTSFTKLGDNDSDVGAYRLVAAGSYTTAGGSATASSPNIVSMLHLPEASGGGSNSTAANPATETDAAQPAARTRITTAGTATETDQAQAAARTRQTAAAAALETDTAQTVARTRTTAVSAAAETDTAQAAARTRTTTLGAALETDAAQSVSSPGGTPVTPATELDQAQPAGRTRTTTLGTATEADQALPAARTRIRAAGVAQETDVALGAALTRFTPAVPALETDTAVPAGNPSAISYDLLLVGAVEPDRYRARIEVDRWTAAIDPNRYRTRVEAP
jgi:hypothetical protein